MLLFRCLLGRHIVSDIYRIFKEFNVKLIFSKLSTLNSFAKVSRLMVTAILCGIFSACGGGGGGGGNQFTQSSSSSSSSASDSLATWQSGVFKPQANFANKCAAPRTGIDPATNKAFADTKGTVLDENNFLRSWSNDTYLWYSDITDVNPASYSDPLKYFALLKSNAKTASGNNKDNFHFTYESSEWYDLSESGVSAGYGFEFSWGSSTPPRSLIVAYTEPGSPAANIKRGAKLIKVDGSDFVNGNTQQIVDVINAGLFPEALNEAHEFTFQNVDSSIQTVTLQSASVTKTPVQNVKILDAANGDKVGYFLFNDHIKTAELGLSNAINQLQGVKDLVLDVRYNGGGYLYIASELAYMIAGNNIKAGSFFEKTAFNNKHTTTDINGNALETTPFYGGSQENGAFPTLNLKRVYVITSGDTCSASESIINGLRGIGVEVIQIGSKTCGKPYGFYPQDNCGTTYFTIQFKGVNYKEFGEYSDGFIPSATDNDKDLIKGCTLGDDLSHALGDTAEKNLATALNYRASGSCTLPVSSASSRLQKTTASDELSNVTGTLNKAPGLTNRIMK